MLKTPKHHVVQCPLKLACKPTSTGPALPNNDVMFYHVATAIKTMYANAKLLLSQQLCSLQVFKLFINAIFQLQYPALGSPGNIVEFWHFKLTTGQLLAKHPKEILDKGPEKYMLRYLSNLDKNGIGRYLRILVLNGIGRISSPDIPSSYRGSWGCVNSRPSRLSSPWPP